MKFSASIHFLFSCLTLIISWGCLGIGGGGEVQPTFYYTLEPIDISDLQEGSDKSPLIVGLNRVEVPGYLDRREIAIRTGTNELRYTRRHLWAEKLSDRIPRVLALNIERQANEVIEVHPLPWPDQADPKWSVTVDVQAFEGQEAPNPTLVVEIAWSIQSSGSGEILKQGHFVGGNNSWVAGDYSTMARNLSDGLAAVGRLIFKDLEELWHN